MFKSLAYIPFWDPLQTPFPHLADYSLWFLVPLVVVVSLVYKATKVEQLQQLPRATAWLVAQILFFMALATVGIEAVYRLANHFYGGGN